VLRCTHFRSFISVIGAATGKGPFTSDEPVQHSRVGKLWSGFFCQN
jgi:hypothetical protein